MLGAGWSSDGEADFDSEDYDEAAGARYNGYGSSSGSDDSDGGLHRHRKKGRKKAAAERSDEDAEGDAPGFDAAYAGMARKSQLHERQGAANGAGGKGTVGAGDGMSLAEQEALALKLLAGRVGL
jgi:hypothetical protein